MTTLRIALAAFLGMTLLGLNPGVSRTTDRRAADREQIARVVSSCIGWAKDKDLQ